MGFIELLDKELIRVPVESVTKNDVLEELVKLIESSGKINDYDLALQDVLKREMLCSTGLERGHSSSARQDDSC